MSQIERLEAALRSPEPGRALRMAILELAAEGSQQPELYALLEKLLLDSRAREDHLESGEDVILDVMDALAGWCHPEARLFPEQRQS